MISTFVYSYTGKNVAYQAHVTILDQGLVVVLAGGDSHVGTMILAEPRKSLRDACSWSATSSVINRVGHKDEIPLRENAERLAAQLKLPVVVTGGIHIEALDTSEIEQILKEVRYIFRQLEKKLKRST